MVSDDVKKVFETVSRVQGILYRPWTDRFRFVDIECDGGWMSLKRAAAEYVEVEVGDEEDDEGEDSIGERMGEWEVHGSHVLLFNNCDGFFSGNNPLSSYAAQWSFWDEDDLGLFGPCLFLRADGDQCHMADLVTVAGMKQAVIDEKQADED